MTCGAKAVTYLLTNSAIGRWFSRLAPTGGMLRAVVALGGATLITQVAGVLLAPVLARLYSPADYGLFSVYNAILSTSLTVGCLCYEMGITISKDDSEALILTMLSVILVVLMGFGSVAWLGADALFGLGGSGSQLGSYSWFVPVGIIAAGVYQPVRYWALRRKAMGAIARTTISQLVSSKTISLGFGILFPSALGLILSAIAGSGAGMWGLARGTRLIPNLRAEHGFIPPFRLLWATARKYRQLPLVSAPSTLFNSLGLYLPGFLMAPYFGADFAGQFFMAVSVIAIPSTLIGGALSQVFFSSAAVVARERPEELASFFHHVFVRGATCSLLVLLAGLTAPWVIPFALGAKWRLAGEIAFWLSFYYVGGLMISSLSSIPQVVGRLGGQFAINVARAVAVLLVICVGHWAGLSGMAVVKAYTLVMVANYVACYLLYCHLVKAVSRSGRTAWHGQPPTP